MVKLSTTSIKFRTLALIQILHSSPSATSSAFEKTCPFLKEVAFFWEGAVTGTARAGDFLENHQTVKQNFSMYEATE